MARTIQVGLSDGSAEPLVCIGGQQRGPVCLSRSGGWIAPGGAEWKNVTFYFDGQALMVSTSSPEPVLVAGRPIGPGWNLVPALGTVQVGARTFLVQERLREDGETVPGHAPPESSVGPNSVQRGESTMFGHLGDLLETSAKAATTSEVTATNLEHVDPNHAGIFDLSQILRRQREGSPDPSPVSTKRTLVTRDDAPTSMVSPPPAAPRSRSSDGTMVGLPIPPPPSPGRVREPGSPPARVEGAPAPIAHADAESGGGTVVGLPIGSPPALRPVPAASARGPAREAGTGSVASAEPAMITAAHVPEPRAVAAPPPVVTPPAGGVAPEDATMIDLDWQPGPTAAELSSVTSDCAPDWLPEELGAASAANKPLSTPRQMILVTLLSLLAIAGGIAAFTAF